MTIRETIKRALTHARGNKPTDLSTLVLQLPTEYFQDADNILQYSSDQLRRALRDIPYVKRVNGRYVVKGRRVPNGNT